MMMMMIMMMMMMMISVVLLVSEGSLYLDPARLECSLTATFH